MKRQDNVLVGGFFWRLSVKKIVKTTFAAAISLLLCSANVYAAKSPVKSLAKSSSKSSAKSPAKTSAKSKAPAKSSKTASKTKSKGAANLKAAASKNNVRVSIRGNKGSKAKSTSKVSRVKSNARISRVAAVAPRLSVGQKIGLHNVFDPLNLNSGAALVMDESSKQILFSKNVQAVLPIASITKLMTGLLISEANLPMNEQIMITPEDVDTEKGSRSRLTVGTVLSRGDLMHLALMSSENRAAHALARTYPGGMKKFISLMNARALMLGMKDTKYVEPTGLSSQNRSSAVDLALLVSAATNNQHIRQFSTSTGHEIEVGSRTLSYNNTNKLVHDEAWQIGLQKTGYIAEAGRCLVMQTRVAGRNVIMVFLDAGNKSGRIEDAQTVRQWIENGGKPLASGTIYSKKSS